MISNHLDQLKRIALLVCLGLMTGCAATLPVEPPICVPLRDFVLQPPTVAEQLAIKRLDGGNLLGKIASNDARLKSHVRVLEGVILAHDAPLGDCF